MADAAQSIFFVVDGKELEVKSWLLAFTLARHHRVGRDVSLIAYVTDRSHADLDPATRAIYAAAGVEMRRLPTPDGVWAMPYPHGNKILAAALPRTSQRSTFLGTDMICQASITDISPGDPHEVFVIPEGRRTWGKKVEDWTPAYAFFDLPMPADRVTLMRGRNVEYLPYFNAGFISFSDLALAQDGKAFGRLWPDAARRFDFHCPVDNKRPWLDQITLPLVMALHGMDCLILPESYNYSISNRPELTSLPQARMVHYHRPSFFHTMPGAADLIAMLMDSVPLQHHDAMDLLLAVHFAATGDED